MTNEAKDDIEAGTKSLFDESVAGLDGATRSRLTRARQRALAEVARPRWAGLGFPVPVAAAVAAIAVVAATLVLRDAAEPIPAFAEVAEFSDFDLLLEGDEFDLFEDLEFYAWLEEQPELEGAEGAVDGAG
jgi:hypothetical protein